MIALIDVDGQKMPIDDNGDSLFAAKIDVHKNVAEITVRIPMCLEGDDMDCADVKYQGTGLVKTSLDTLLNDFIETQKLLEKLGYKFGPDELSVHEQFMLRHPELKKDDL